MTTVFLLSRGSVRFLEIAQQNLGKGLGGWGTMGPLLIIAAVVGVALTTRRDEPGIMTARWLIISFTPTVLLAILGAGLERPETELDTFFSGGARVGWGDSVNRMWAHIVLVIAYLLRRASSPSLRMPNSQGSASRTSRADHKSAVRDRVTVSAVVLLLFGPWIAIQWQPTYIPWSSVVVETLVGGVPGVTGEENALTVLADGVQVDQTLVLDMGALAPQTIVRAVCVDVPLVTLGRPMTGNYRLELSVGGQTAVRHIEWRDVVDWGSQRACVDLGTDSASVLAGNSTTVARVTITGSGAALEEAAGVLVASGFPSMTGAVISTRNPDTTTETGRVGPLALSVVVVIDDPIGIFSQPIERSPLALPWLALAVGVLATIAPVTTKGGGSSPPTSGRSSDVEVKT
jgi:hypothetical protein